MVTFSVVPIYIYASIKTAKVEQQKEVDKNLPILHESPPTSVKEKKKPLNDNWDRHLNFKGFCSMANYSLESADSFSKSLYGKLQNVVQINPIACEEGNLVFCIYSSIEEDIVFNFLSVCVTTSGILSKCVPK
ncbi:hypothetical protein CEXT_172221 [Caerostris extrusa]|uniref:Uncharacterized protein n=1 Tax=Caerostris extrusa TaxID=172846 RepID=A0AAV4X9J6_CAEEX|nr:hypothetical protein CEXT_172221 [Caerostris extrusa]